MSATARRSTRERNAEIMRQEQQAIAQERALEEARTKAWLAKTPEEAFRDTVRDAINLATDAIGDSVSYMGVESALYSVARTLNRESERLQHEREVKASKAILDAMEDVAEQDSVSGDELADGIRRLNDVSSAVRSRMGRSVDDLALALKDKAGEALLAEHLPRAREQVEAIMARAFYDHGITSGSLMAPGAVNDGIAAYKASVGGNDGASEVFFDHLLERGDYPDRQALGVAFRNPSQKRKIDNEYRAWLREKAFEHDPALRQDLEGAEQAGRDIIALAKQATGITPRHAAQLAANHTQSGKGVRGVASRAGWNPKQFDADVVELMQVAGKSLPSDSMVFIGSKGDIEQAAGVRLRTSGRGRSFQSTVNVTGNGRVSKTYICMSGAIDKRTLYHEMGHAIESVNPVANAMVARWLRGRIEGEEAKSLARLTGIRAYRRNEVAVKDHFIDPYVGKTYGAFMGIQANEVLAMGLERLADPMAAAQFAAKDPDHLALILAALQLEYQP